MHCFTTCRLMDLPRAQVLARTLARHHPAWPLSALITDRLPTGATLEPSAAGFDRVIFVDELHIDGLDEWIGQHDIPRIEMAAVGALVGRLIDDGADKVLYLHPGLAVFDSLHDLETLLDEHELLLPSSTLATGAARRAAYRDRRRPTVHVDHGLGFVALRGGETGRDVAAALVAEARRVRTGDFPGSAFGAEHWVAGLLGSLSDVHVVSDGSYQDNFYLSTPIIEITTDGDILAGGKRLKLFNFSEVSADGPDVPGSGFATANLAYYEICQWYRHALRAEAPPQMPAGWWYGPGAVLDASSIMDVPTRYGVVRTFDDGDLISRTLLEYGEWSHLETQFLRAFVRPDHAVFDVGAYLGTFALGLAGLAPFKSLVAVDANPAAYERLVSNLRRHIAVPCRTKLAAVGQWDGVTGAGLGLRAHVDRRNRGALQWSAPESDLEAFETLDLDVPVVSLKALREEYGAYDVLKLDVEGMELLALASDAAWIREHHPVIWLECNETPDNLAVLDFLAWSGYASYYFAFPAYDPDKLARRLALNAYSFEAGLLAVSPGQGVGLGDDLRRKGCFLRPLANRAALKEALWITPRYSLPEWEGKSQYQLAALHGRLRNGEDYAGYLREDP